MKNNQYLKITTVAAITFGILGGSTSDALAKKCHKHPVRHHPYYGKKVSLPELIAKAIVIGGLEYYYHHGYFYKRGPGGYVIVDAPLGAVVEAIPSGYKVVIINGKTYYYYNDIYFAKRGKKYVVVSDPVYQVVELPKEVKVIDKTPTVVTETASKVTVQSNKTVVDQENEFVVNILNANGSYTPVKIARSGDGFVGPQGEYYTEFPKVEQLKVMYSN